MPNPPIQGSEFGQGEFGDSLFNAPAPATTPALIYVAECPVVVIRFQDSVLL